MVNISMLGLPVEWVKLREERLGRLGEASSVMGFGRCLQLGYCLL